MQNTISLIGHRGGSSEQGENTQKAFAYGFSHGADFVECDLTLTKDNVICISHDQSIKIHGIKKYICDISYEELLKQKPDTYSIENVLKDFPDKIFVFELKDTSDYKKIIDIFSSQYTKQFAKNRFISFSLEALQYVKSKNNEIYCVYIGTSLKHEKDRFEPFISQKHIERCVKNNLQELSGHWLTFSSAMIQKAHKNNIKVGIGPVNRKIIYNRCVKNGVDCVYTDHVSKIYTF